MKGNLDIYTIENYNGNLYFKVKIDSSDSSYSNEFVEPEYMIRTEDTNTLYIKALLISILMLLPLFIKIKEIPIKKVKTLLIKKPDQFLFPSKKSKNPGISIAKESHNRKIPITDTIGCIIIDAVFIILLYTYLVSLYTIYELIILY